MDEFEKLCCSFPLRTSLEIEKALAFTWFHLKSREEQEISLREIRDYFIRAKLHAPNITRLKLAIIGHRDFTKRGKDKFGLVRFVVEEFDQQYGTIFSSQDACESTILESVNLKASPCLDEAAIENAYKMATLYTICHCYENSARQLIQGVLEKKIGSNWWAVAASGPMKTKLKDRREREAKNKWLTPRGNNPLFYMDWGDLLNLIRKYEPDFLPLVKNIKFVELRFEEMELIRNIIAHNGVVSDEDDIQRFKIAFNDWCRQITSE